MRSFVFMFPLGISCAGAVAAPDAGAPRAESLLVGSWTSTTGVIDSLTFSAEQGLSEVLATYNDCGLARTTTSARTWTIPVAGRLVFSPLIECHVTDTVCTTPSTSGGCTARSDSEVRYVYSIEDTMLTLVPEGRPTTQGNTYWLSR